ncbi:TetR/AcrR family transcriptional regulator [Frondihabitans cladoniiphilus]|uniref:TetR/AcrR family transcriptional regulator n=1 Tax=Frondihabitans cladoniiphilus TaxID=715785 RepID=A0ABP8W118_9MICO
MTIRAESAPRALRADAERNRELILRTATRLFAERGIEVTLNDIAHEAGLGVGTVYRRFPDKPSLIAALADHKLQLIRDGMQETLANCSVGDAFRGLMLSAAEARANDRGLFKVVFQSGDRSPEGHRRVTELLHVWAKLVQQAKEAGAVRQGFSASDVDLFMLMVGTVADATREIDPQAWRRCAEVLLDGYAPRAGDTALAELDLDDEARRRIFLC